MGIAAEYKAKVNNSGVPKRIQAARDNLWEYNKLINPKFFRIRDGILKSLRIRCRHYLNTEL